MPVRRTFANGDTRVVLTPMVPLQGSTAHTLTVGAVTDLSGLPLATPVTRQFTTGSSVELSGPVVTSVTPANGAQNVAVDTAIQLTFSKRMNALTITAAALQLVEQNTGARITGDIVVSADGRNVAFVPGSALTPATTYYVQGSGFADLAGHELSVFTSFRTTP